ncbi:MAG: serine protease [Sphingobacteriales bacterium]|nr:MAG: serine protease [Sphingobacteriales bacterium]
MAIDSNNIWKLAEAYVGGTLQPSELVNLKERLANDAAFAAEFHECANMLRSLNGSGEQNRFRNMLKSIHATHVAVPVKTTKENKVRTIPLRTHYLRTCAIAASIALLTSLTTFWAIQHNNKKINSQYSLLKRDLETYKRATNEVVNSINTTKDTKQIPQAEVRYTGTGFAVTNDGYVVTNYHVTEGADSVYIQNREGRYYKAYVVSFDKQSDISLLKVEDKGFRFSKTDIPYTFANNKRSLGDRVYTLGYPQDEIVYSEGYIAAKNGYEGDSLQYRLQIPAAPGQSGAPVIDNNGTIIGIITGKESETEGTTYAVSSGALLRMLHNVPKENEVRLVKNNKLSNLNRQQQIEKLQSYTCSIKVYKK